MTTELNQNAPAGAPAAGTPAAPAAPAAPAVPEVKAPIELGAPEQKPEAKVEAVVYESTGDAALDMGLQFLGGVGLGPTDPAILAAEKGDFTMLEAKLAVMGDKAKGWEANVKMVKQAYERVTKQHSDAQAATRAVIEKAVDGPARWAAIQAWASKNADPAEKVQVNAAFAAGGAAAKAMALYLAECYDKAPGTKPAPKSAVGHGAKPAAGADEHALSPRAYTAEVAKLRNKVGDPTGHPAYQELQARRRAWRG